MSKKQTELAEKAKFMKANKQRREAIAKQKGFSSAKMYLAYLNSSGNSKGTKKKKNSTKPTIHNIYLIDRSGSMAGGKLEAALSAVNEEVRELKKSKDATFLQTIAVFSGRDDQVKLCVDKPVDRVNEVRFGTQGMTALNDAVYDLLSEYLGKYDKNRSYIIKIFTDGGENNSLRYTKSDVAKRVKECEKLGFTVTFIGTEEDAEVAVRSYMLSGQNVITHDNTSKGITFAMNVATVATKRYASKLSAGEKVDNLAFYDTSELQTLGLNKEKLKKQKI